MYSCIHALSANINLGTIIYAFEKEMEVPNKEKYSVHCILSYHLPDVCSCNHLKPLVLLKRAIKIMGDVGLFIRL